MSTKKLSQFSTALEEEGQPVHKLLPFDIAAPDASPFHSPSLFISSNDQAATRAEFYDFSGQHQQYQEPGDLFSLQSNHYGGTSFKDQSSYDIDVVSDQVISHDSPIKWMSSKMRLMRKMLGSEQITMNKPRRGMQPPQDQVNDLHNPDSGIGSISLSGAVIRTCSDCNTTKTPLWRSGPQGPKSLCNACGIRQMKARRAMAASSAATPKKEITRKEKKSDVDRTIPYKKRYKFTNPGVDDHEKLRFDHATAGLSDSSPAGFHPAFPQDEKDAAILLMTLSCGMIHT